MLHPDLDDVRAVAFDLDGTLYQDGQALPGAVDTVEALRAAEVPMAFLTNTTSKARGAVVQRLRGHGFPADAGPVLSPPALAGERLRRDGGSALLLVADATLPDFDGVPQDPETPDWVVVGDLGRAWTFDRLNAAFRALHAGARLIALGRTRYWRAPEGLQLDAGPFVAALEYATGQEALTLGKPAPAFFQAAAAALGAKPNTIALVGDDAVTDVSAAQKAGFRGVLVRTGKFSESDLEDVQPDLVLDGVAELVQQR